MIHVMDIIEFPKSDRVKEFSIENSLSTSAEFTNTGLCPKIILTKDVANMYVNESKVYFLHTYGDIYSLTDDIFATVFVYNSKDDRYHIGICKSTLFNTMHTDVELVDLTVRLDSNAEYWIPKYCSYNFEKFHAYQTTLLSIFDTEKEAKKDMLEQVIKKYRYKLGIEKAKVVSLNNKDIYEREFNKLFEPRLAELKEEIADELNNRKLQAEKDVYTYTNKITYITEELNKI